MNIRVIKKLLLVSLLLALTGCYTETEWEREEYWLSDGKESEVIVDGYRVAVSFLPQNHSGFRGLSYKGPYKVKVHSSGEAGKFTHLNILSVNAKLLTSNKSISLIESPIEVAFELRSNIDYYGGFFVSEQHLQPDFASGEHVEVAVEFELSNKETLLSHRSTAKFLLVPKHSKGKTKIPWITT